MPVAESHAGGCAATAMASGIVKRIPASGIFTLLRWFMRRATAGANIHLMVRLLSVALSFARGSHQAPDVEDQDHPALAEDRGPGDVGNLAVIALETLDHDLLLPHERVDEERHLVALGFEHKEDPRIEWRGGTVAGEPPELEQRQVLSACF